MISEPQITALFEAEPLYVVCRAADQDGYDGGCLAYDAEREAWGETKEEAKLALEKARGSI